MRVSRQTSSLCGARCLTTGPVPQAHSVNSVQVRNHMHPLIAVASLNLIGEWHLVKMYLNNSPLSLKASLLCVCDLTFYIFPLLSLVQPASPTSQEAVYRTCTPDTPVSARRLARERAAVPSVSEKTTVIQVGRK